MRSKQAALQKTFETEPRPNFPSPHLSLVETPPDSAHDEPLRSDLSRGVMRRKGNDHSVAVLPENEHLFLYSSKNECLELNYLNSSFVVGFLACHQTIRDGEWSDGRERTLSMFDVNGNFYHHLRLKELEMVSKNGTSTSQKHTAHFEAIDELGVKYELPVPIDDIYTISYSRPGFPLVQDEAFMGC